MSDKNNSLTVASSIGLSRRRFLQLSSYLGVGAFLATHSLNSIAASVISEHVGEITKWHNCWAHCHSSCLLKIVTENGQIKRIETDDQGDDVFGRHQVRACLRGRSLHKRAFSPDRLKYPMKRIGKRGEGKFKRISWDEALDEVYLQMSKIISKYGNQAIFNRIGFGKPDGPYHFVPRFLNLIGGFLSAEGNYSSHQIDTASKYTYGESKYTFGSAPSEMAHSDLIVYFGNNPANTRMSGANDTYHYQHYKKQSSAKTVIIDPQYTDTACGREDLWLAIRPGSDAALVEAIAWVLITEKFVDEEFLHKYCYGYDGEPGDSEKGIPSLEPSLGYKAYILGDGPDKLEKKPEYAESICGIPSEQIYQLARALGNAKAPFIAQGWGPQRHAAGEQTARAIFMLPILLGKIGLPGTNNGGSDFMFSGSDITPMPIGKNGVQAKVPCFKWLEAVERGHEMTALSDGITGAERLTSDVKCIFMYQGNWLLNQHSDCNATAKILADESKLEFIFVMDNHMTASAKFADILLPDITWLENSRVVRFATHLTLTEHVLDPMYECRHPYQVFSDLAERFGVREAFCEGRSWDEWQQYLYEESRKKHPEFPPFDVLQKKKTIRLPFDPEAPGYVMREFREDPIIHALKTESGKIQIYSHTLAQYAANWQLPDGDKITPLPQYIPTWESYADTETREKYPLQLIGFKSKGRPHSTFHNVPWLREVIQDALMINPLDARARNLHQGQQVHVYNDRGVISVPIRITPRIMPGVVGLGEGAWYSPDSHGVDVGGCINTLTRLKPTALAKANPQGTNLVEVSPAP
ncbi:DMSO/selenate family reductase complex A subunit [Shimwellia blattae]|uniref:Anaerobic dimethyl sulfoxide reductase chain A n=1 Tax=Shimwellia blattae (strain ATCC 29907 / DSM 4481 / JCM 1650 / NBRC 105725 / CDC 9005-74) TaxID=630626 RepID=I2B617_SHIBC|nr:DMSO/selenate family reductase complex A subunit [Shimwellia blattae]AFJ45971.1 anaerobic dimethyl sulfoxide reductase chain A precursor [Shimwellia blattae DSM 4481 = NBRC 105725]GAB81726.1 anaerobic dimethyl sulfoxide reductase subunit A [Shimwellia blattae DSM 4481 = NBRC 105725]VDY63447.1 Dimethyl sulfoxide reductase DmsA precursor [Shimwellia blattae]VEC21349.1 Dimethyl sulfoxide reductase DmsA precursor [Shimwellia blattae]